MARPDLSKERTGQILDALEHCIARYGLEGSSLELIAEEAGVKRSIIRHYIGNRDELLVALTKRLIERSLALIDLVVAALPRRNRSKVLVDYLFSDDSESSSDSAVALDLLIAMSEQYPTCRELLREFMEQMVAKVAEQLELAHPSTSPKQCWSVANGVLAIVFVADSLAPLSLPKNYKKSWKQNATQLIKSLVAD